MRIIRAPNVNISLPRTLRMIKASAVVRESRAGKCYELPWPVTTIYERPWERVLLAPERDSNPTFHLMEALWMLAGRNDIEFLTFYNRRMSDFSDDGVIQHGAYGHRWRNHFDRDQLANVIDLLKNKPKSRRGVVQMYDPRVDVDISETLKDVPCNLSITFQINHRKGMPVLDMSVFCRSNDAIWGAAGANAVHFPILQEYIAMKIGVSIGIYNQISINLHTYENTYQPLIDSGILKHASVDPYRARKATEFREGPFIDDPYSFDEELHEFLEASNKTTWKNSFFPYVAIPMARAYQHFRTRSDGMKYDDMIKELRKGNEGVDWIVAAKEWTWRRRANWAIKMEEKRYDPQ